MSWWSERRAVATIEPEQPIDRAAETQTRVTELKRELDALDGEMLRFKKTNRVTTDKYGRLLGVLCADINGRAAIDAQWRALLKRRDGLVSAWHRALFEWAEAKGANNENRLSIS